MSTLRSRCSSGRSSSNLGWLAPISFSGLHSVHSDSTTRRCHISRLRSKRIPATRVVLGQIGRLHFLQRRFDDAIATFEEVLRIDPEDLLAHYNLMLSYQGAGASERAAAERVLYERFKADEAAQAITGPYRLASPEDNNERQSVHEHGSSPPPS